MHIGFLRTCRKSKILRKKGNKKNLFLPLSKLKKAVFV